MKLNRTWAMVVAIVMALTLSLSGTLAYLQDTDEAVNVMTLGNVQIEQLEYQRAEGVEHITTANYGDLVPFVQGKPLYPAVPKAGEKNPYTAEKTALFSWGPYVTAAEAGNGLWNDSKIANVVDKFVFVKNTGKSDAYYRTLFAFECPEGMEYSQGSDKHFMMNVNGNDRFDWINHGYITVKGVRYLLMSATYNEILAPGEISRPSLLQVLMTEHCTNEHMELLGDSYEILVVSQAVQVAGFEDAETALNQAFGEVSTTSHPWIDMDDPENDNDQAPDGVKIPTVVSSAEELKAAFADLDAHIVLANDITLTGEWTPIGDKEKGEYFTGTLDGNNHFIEGLSVTSGDYAALISAAKDATIKDVQVSGQVSAQNAAGIVARVEGNTVIEGCTNHVTVNGTTKAGGITSNVTSANAKIIGCENFGKVSCSKEKAGGVGGLIGYVNTDAVVEVIACMNMASVTGTDGQTTGAVVGYAAANSAGKITDFMNMGSVSGSNYKGDGHDRWLEDDNGLILAGYCGTPANWTVE